MLHVTAPAPAGGLESVIQTLVPAQAARGHAVAVVAVVVPGDTAAQHLFEPLRSVPARLEAVELPARAYLREGRALARIAREHDADVLHTHGYRSDVVGGMVARAVRRPCVSTVHGFVGGGGRGRLHEHVQRRMLRRFDAVVAVSAPLVDGLAAAGIARERIHLVPNAWAPARPSLPRAEARSTLGLEPDRLHLGWVGRLSQEKGPDVAVRALAAMERTDVTLTFVGDGPLRKEAAALAAELGVADRVAFTGLVAGAGRLLGAFDVLLLSSRTEGTPMVVLEAMAAGVPVVATAVGGVPDVLSGVGELVAPERPRELAEALERALGDPQRSAGLAERARERMHERFAPGPWAAAYERVYRGVVG